jgi:hypothetical protein
MNRALTISLLFLFLKIPIEKQPSASVNPDIQLFSKEGERAKGFNKGISFKGFNLGAFVKDKYHLCI